MRKNFGWSMGFLLALLLAWGVVRAANSRYQQRQEAILAACRAEQNRLGSDSAAVRTKYPTPEQIFCRVTRVVPDGSAEVVAKAKFMSGTQFLFDNDRIEVVKETTTPTEYRATVRATGSDGPDYANLYAYQPVRCLVRDCLAVYVGGKYEWEFTADSGWRIRLKPLKELSEGESMAVSAYCTEFYRGGETKPFKTRRATLGGAPEYDRGGYHATISDKDGCEETAPEDGRAEMAKLQQKMAKFTELSEKERQQVMTQMAELSQRQAKAMQAQTAQMRDPTYLAQLDKEKKEFGCTGMNFWRKGSDFVGNMGCGENVGKRGRLELKGSAKYLGP